MCFLETDNINTEATLCITRNILSLQAVKVAFIFQHKAHAFGHARESKATMQGHAPRVELLKAVCTFTAHLPIPVHKPNN